MPPTRTDIEEVYTGRMIADLLALVEKAMEPDPADDPANTVRYADQQEFFRSQR
jgi:hypothetical protein